MKKIIPAFEKDNIVLSFFSDNKYVPYVGTAIYSAICNNSHNLDIIIFEDSYSKESKQQLLKLGEGKDNVSIRFLSVNMFANKLNVEATSRHSLSCYAKLFCTDEIFSEYNRMIVMDSDLLVLGDLYDLMNINLDGKLMGAVRDQYNRIMSKNNYHTGKYFRYISMEEYYRQMNIDLNDYYNSGVLVFDIHECQKENMQEQLISYNNMVIRSLCPAQDDFNYLFHNKIKEIPLQWNYQNPYSIISHLKDFPEDYVEKGEKAVVMHYMGKSKPWRDDKGLFADIYLKYIKQTEWYDSYVNELINYKKKNRIYNMIMPKGSMRREIIMKIQYGIKSLICKVI